MKEKTALFHTLGCKVNQYETEVLKRLLLAAGFAPCPVGEAPSVVVINSCTVTGQGDKKTMQLLRRMRRQYPTACLVLCGCFPQAFPQKAAVVAEADVITGSYNRSALPHLIAHFFKTGQKVCQITPHQPNEAFEPMEAVTFSEKTRAFLKIQDGCQRRCAYCIIPDARGYLRSRPLEELKEQLAQIAANGYREVVLVGINLSMYGVGQGACLADAVELAASMSGIERVRLGSLEPDLLSEETVARLAKCEKLCPQFHLALQSGCDDTLKRMNRHYNTAEYATIAQTFRKYFPNCALTTDLMVGFAGETEAEFAQSMAFARQMGFAKIHVFAYSRRPGTPADTFENQVPEAEKKRRSAMAQQMAAQSRLAFLEAKVGQTEQMLVEQLQNGYWQGHTADYTPLLVQATSLPAEDWKNRLLKVQVLKTDGDGCLAAPLNRA